MQTLRGSCHCGAVTFEDREPDFPELTTCDCSICRRKNALMVKVHEDRFRLLSGEDSLTEYRFHTHDGAPLLLQDLRHLSRSIAKRVTPDYLGINVVLPRGLRSTRASRCARRSARR